MKKSLLSRLNPRLKWRGIRGLRYNEDGISAVEFALIAPFLALLFFGCIELSLMMRADRKVTTTASSLGDLTTRLAAVSDDDMSEMFEAAKAVMQPQDVTNTRMRITSIVADGAGVTTVDWSDAYQMTAYVEDAPITVPTGLVAPNGSVILAEVEYDYSAHVGFVIQGTKSLEDKFYLRPRRVNVIPRNRDDDDTTGFGAGS